MIGVAGHREISPTALDGIEASVAGVFDELLRDYPHTPLTVISSLAAGADTLVAEIALARGIPLIAILPMEASAYRADFQGPTLERFEHALDGARSVLVVPCEGNERSDLYRAAGAHLAHYADILIAIWDGQPARGAGGTADVVAFRLDGVPVRYGFRDGLLAMADVGPVFVITAAREDGSDVQPAAIEKRFPSHAGDAAAETLARAGWERRDRLNIDLHLHDAPAGPLRATLINTLDGLANQLQKRTLLSVRALYCLAAIAGVAQIVTPFTSIGSIVKVAAIAFAFSALFVTRRSNIQNKFQDYRTLATALAVQDIWARVGLGSRVEGLYLRFHNPALEWMRSTLRTAALLELPEQQHSDGSAISTWIESQCEYFSRAAVREKHRKRLFDALVGAMLVANAVASTLVVLLSLPFTRQIGSATSLHAAVIGASMLVGATIVLAALFRDYAQRRAFAMHAEHYARMAAVFLKARALLLECSESSKRTERERAILDELGHAAIAENSSWLIRSRLQPIEIIRI